MARDHALWRAGLRVPDPMLSNVRFGKILQGAWGAYFHFLMHGKDAPRLNATVPSGIATRMPSRPVPLKAIERAQRDPQSPYEKIVARPPRRLPPQPRHVAHRTSSGFGRDAVATANGVLADCGFYASVVWIVATPFSSTMQLSMAALRSSRARTSLWSPAMQNSARRGGVP